MLTVFCSGVVVSSVVSSVSASVSASVSSKSIRAVGTKAVLALVGPGAGDCSMSHDLPDNIRWFRRARQLSQQELASLCGIKQQYLSALERGLRPSDPRHIDVLAQALGVSRTTLLRRQRFVRYPSTPPPAVPHGASLPEGEP